MISQSSSSGKDHPDGSDRPHHQGPRPDPARRPQGQGLTQAELAARAGVWQRTVSNIETGASGAKAETIFDLLAALDLELRIVPRKQDDPRVILRTSSDGGASAPMRPLDVYMNGRRVGQYFRAPDGAFRLHLCAGMAGLGEHAAHLARPAPCGPERYHRPARDRGFREPAARQRTDPPPRGRTRGRGWCGRLQACSRASGATAWVRCNSCPRARSRGDARALTGEAV